MFFIAHSYNSLSNQDEVTKMIIFFITSLVALEKSWYCNEITVHLDIIKLLPSLTNLKHITLQHLSLENARPTIGVLAYCKYSDHMYSTKA